MLSLFMTPVSSFGLKVTAIFGIDLVCSNSMHSMILQLMDPFKLWEVTDIHVISAVHTCNWT